MFLGAGGLAAVAVTFTQQRDYIWGELPFTGACPHESLSVLKSSELKVPMQSEEIEERQKERKKEKKVSVLRTRRHNLLLPDWLSWKDTRPLCG